MKTEVNLEILRAEDYKVLWQIDHYDGPMSGILKTHKDEMLYFNCFIDECIVNNEDQENETIFHYRVFSLHKLIDNEKEIFISRKYLCNKYTGNGSEWDFRWDLEKRVGLKIDWKEYEKEKSKLPEYPQLGFSSIVAYTTDDELYRSRVLNGQIKK